STALVAFPSALADEQRLVSARMRAALLYAIAGWFGSAMGIGMAQDLHAVPVAFLISAGVVMILVQRISHTLRLRAIGLILVVSCCTVAHPSVADADDGERLAAAGRAVYIAEGCIHCHSQFVRPGTKDVEMWGPYVPPDEILRGVPPLIGNRRHGPDLLNVGNRRSADWLELHLRAPRMTQAGSPMPSYEYLFRDERGAQLVQYLLTLGKDTISERLRFIASWSPGPSPAIGTEEAASLFQDGCAVCHGAEGRGDGPLASLLRVRPRNLVRESPRTFDADAVNAEIGYARVIRFGIPGSSMPGHEYYDDGEIKGLVSYVKSLRVR
ncbi:MAG: cbb3-type cytochrome c oxidase subunit II, partial [Bdellovibrionales bacterium]|nr:cbb3-type cytochrome c oxidase subunit II [Bdellovibrionales bacterium]